MQSRNERLLWSAVATAASLAAAWAATEAMNGAWRAWRKEEPPEDPADPDVGWTGTLLWGAATGLVLGLVRVVTLRGVAYGRERGVGRKAPVGRLGNGRMLRLRSR